MVDVHTAIAAEGNPAALAGARAGVTAPIDALGRFLLRTPAGPTRLVVALADRPRPIATEYFRA